MYKIVPFKSYANYIEIDQQLDVKFSLAKKSGPKEVQELFTPIKCRDYFNDLLYAEENKKSVMMYGFNWDGTKQLLDKDKLRLIITVSDLNHKTKILQNLKEYLNPIEKSNKIKLTKIHEDPDNKDKLFVEADPFWMANSFKISLYTYLLKCLSFSTFINHIPNGYNEKQYLTMFGLEKLQKLFTKLREIPELPDTTCAQDKFKNNLYVIHDQGFVKCKTGPYTHPKLKEFLQKL